MLHFVIIRYCVLWFISCLICFAVCLDGSPPAYHFDKGFGAGINNWLVHIDVMSSFSI